jgi:hypothetical protein
MDDTPSDVMSRAVYRKLGREYMMNRSTVLVLAALFCLTPLTTPRLTAATAALQETHSLHAERTVDFQTRKVFDLKAQVGQVRIAGRMRPGSDSEASTTIRAHFLAENPTSEDWQVSFIVEFLDKNGKVIDRATKKQKWDGEAKPYDFDHQILEYVVPLIAQVRIKLEGKLD